MSEPPEKKQPWGKYFAERGGARPPAGGAPASPVPAKPAAPPPPAKPAARPSAIIPKPGVAAASFSGRKAQAGSAPGPAVPPKAKERESAVSDELAAALKQLAAEYAAPAVTSAPFVTAMQKAAISREQKREARRRYAKLAATFFAALIALHFTVTLVVYRAPSLEAVEEHVQDLPAEVIPLYSSTRQPLQADGVTFEETDRVDSQRIRYAAQVRLTLRKPLYIPAVTNGTDAYRQLQERLQAARQRDLKFNIFLPGQGPPVPELPLLIQVAHREGETIVVRVPFEARRRGWRWRLLPPLLALRSTNHALIGDSLEHYATAPYLVFGDPNSRAEIRLLMKQATDYMYSVAKEVQKRSEVQAVEEAPKPFVAPDGVAAAAGGVTTGTDASAKPNGGRPLFDPNAPAVDAKVPAVDPNAPAVNPKAPAFDPNAPAIVVPSVAPGAPPPSAKK